MKVMFFRRIQAALLIGYFLQALALAAHATDPSKMGSAISPGDIRSKNGFYNVMFFSTSGSTHTSLAQARALAAKLLPSIPVSTDVGTTKPPFIAYVEEQPPFDGALIPDAKALSYFGRGLSPADIEAIQHTNDAIGLSFVIPKEQVWDLGRRFTDLILQYAEASHTYIWDDTTRECFTAKSWQDKRLSTWSQNGIPDISKQYTIHLYRPDDNSQYLRAITLGMQKFALPDVVIQRMIGSDYRPAGNLMNVVCQTLAEQPVLTSGSDVPINLDALKAKTLRDTLEQDTKNGATKSVSLALLNTKAEEGDPENRLIQISFQNGAGATEDEKREALLSSFWGSTDSAIGVKEHSAEILEASTRERAKLLTLRPLFLKGLPPGARLLVKAPFKQDTSDANEWMWVEVMKWNEDGEIDGILQNDPFFVRSLHAGAPVTVKFDELFDYIFDHADGTQEGNTTAKLLEEQSASEMEK